MRDKQVEALRKQLWSGVLSEDRTPGSICRVIVSTLGITPEMVDILRSTFDVSPHRAYANDRGLEAADALAALLAVVGEMTDGDN